MSCNECNRLYTGHKWCQPCNAARFKKSFNNWTSGNDFIDEFIKNAQLDAKNCGEVLEWIEYDRVKDVERFAEGCFGIIYKANWKDGCVRNWDYETDQWERSCDNKNVALKSLNDSHDIPVEFLNKMSRHILINNNSMSVSCNLFGFTKDPKTNNFMLVMRWADCNLREYLNSKFNSLEWTEKLDILCSIAVGLENIHNNELIHHNFHCGNILNIESNKIWTVITDSGIYQPVDAQSDKKEIYGVLPYVAPEVLIKKEYGQKCDIYGFGIIAHEVCTGLPPYHGMDFDESLAIEICQGSRPMSDYKVPQLILEIIKKCWDADSSKRPTATELCELLVKLKDDVVKQELLNNKRLAIEIIKQFEEADKINKPISKSTNHDESDYEGSSDEDEDDVKILYKTHRSRLLDYKNLPEPKNANEQSKF